MGKTSPIILTEKQEAWLLKHFKHTKNAEIAEKLGISQSSVARLARKYKLSKTKQFMTKCQLATTKAAWLSNTIHGTFPPKGFQIPNGEKYRFKEGITSRARLGNKKEDERLRKSAESRRETVKKERRRILFGLPQQTNLKLVRQPREKTLLRYALKRHGYIIDNENRVAYWTSETKRSKALETKQQPWYSIKEITEQQNI